MLLPASAARAKQNAVQSSAVPRVIFLVMTRFFSARLIIVVVTGRTTRVSNASSSCSLFDFVSMWLPTHRYTLLHSTAVREHATFRRMPLEQYDAFAHHPSQPQVASKPSCEKPIQAISGIPPESHAACPFQVLVRPCVMDKWVAARSRHLATVRSSNS